MGCASMSGNRFIVTSLHAALLLVVCRPVAAEVPVRDPDRFVIDEGNVIAQAVEREIEGWLRGLHDRTAAQVKVLTVSTTAGEDLHGFARRHARAWSLDRAERPHGALVVLAVRKNEVCIHTNASLERVLTDAWCESLSRSITRSFFKQEQHSAGLRRMTTAIVNAIADDAGVEVDGIPADRHLSSQVPEPGYGAFLVAFVLLGGLFGSMYYLLGAQRASRDARWWKGGKSGMWYDSSGGDATELGDGE